MPVSVVLHFFSQSLPQVFGESFRKQLLAPTVFQTIDQDFQAGADLIIRAGQRDYQTVRNPSNGYPDAVFMMSAGAPLVPGNARGSCVRVQRRYGLDGPVLLLGAHSACGDDHPVAAGLDRFSQGGGNQAFIVWKGGAFIHGVSFRFESLRNSGLVGVLDLPAGNFRTRRKYDGASGYCFADFRGHLFRTF